MQQSPKVVAVSLLSLIILGGCSRSRDGEAARAAAEAARADAETARREADTVRAERDMARAELAKAKPEASEDALRQARAAAEAARADAETARREADTVRAERDIARADLAKAKPDASKDELRKETHSIWTIEPIIDQFTPLTKNIMNASAAFHFRPGDTQGHAAVAKLSEQIQGSKTINEKQRLLERMQYLVRGIYIDDSHEGKARIRQPMLEALEAGKHEEFNRLANRVSAYILMTNASEKGMSEEPLRRMSKASERVSEAKTASEQKEPIAEMQKLLDSFR